MDTLLVRHTLRGLVDGSQQPRLESSIWELEKPTIPETKPSPSGKVFGDSGRGRSRSTVQLHIRTEVFSDAIRIDGYPPASPFFDIARKHFDVAPTPALPVMPRWRWKWGMWMGGR
ncbi:hypothetical protein DXG03_004958 [Asterophora parasitica]|uniref:Uncharacterized protein n=1 Tax=Asterophora parasitica TaxID=117018 RepID=A0A9P7GD69_9AGAR|nr:hypothetical protein DXG03_004958 [Asterophora parasitica]